MILLHDLYRVVTGRISDEELVMVKESEEQEEFEELQKELAAQDAAADRGRADQEPVRGAPMTITVFLFSLLGAMALGMPIAYALLVCGVALMCTSTCSTRRSSRRTSSTAPTASR